MTSFLLAAAAALAMVGCGLFARHFCMYYQQPAERAAEEPLTGRHHEPAPDVAEQSSRGGA